MNRLPSFPAASAVVLAGGRSLRMGEDKAGLCVGRTTLIEHVIGQLCPHFPEILVSAGQPDAWPSLGVPVVADPRPGEGPLLGIATALRVVRHDLAFVVACDIPDLDLGLVARLLGAAAQADVALPRLPGDRWEPLYAVYRPSILPFLDAALAKGERRIRAGFGGARVAVVDVLEAPWMHNLNTPEDVRRWHLARSRPPETP